MLPLHPFPPSTALVLAHSMKEQRVVVSSYAGLLLSSDGGRQRLPGRGKSAVLLAGRLLTALLFVYVGISQASRVWVPLRVSRVLAMAGE